MTNERKYSEQEVKEIASIGSYISRHRDTIARVRLQTEMYLPKPGGDTRGLEETLRDYDSLLVKIKEFPDEFFNDSNVRNLGKTVGTLKERIEYMSE